MERRSGLSSEAGTYDPQPPRKQLIAPRYLSYALFVPAQFRELGGLEAPVANSRIVFNSVRTESLAARILVEEHAIYPDAVAQVLDGGWRIDGRRFAFGDAHGRV